ncbi:hypothetical protein EVAR_50704_1 [Eumeta japonica]|uniref:Uncharacterized protein n=1 Tax=Eumeta variegata TaxID=151549 RepID=A0A4C1YRC7_EUMVA|nr:hypothetical protein EVAR_50704_1 [Eumeta japonica]
MERPVKFQDLAQFEDIYVIFLGETKMLSPTRVTAPKLRHFVTYRRDEIFTRCMACRGTAVLIRRDAWHALDGRAYQLRVHAHDRRNSWLY